MALPREILELVEKHPVFQPIGNAPLVSREKARRHARTRARQGLFVGHSSGADLEGALRAGRESKKAVIVGVQRLRKAGPLDTPRGRVEASARGLAGVGGR